MNAHPTSKCVALTSAFFLLPASGMVMSAESECGVGGRDPEVEFGGQDEWFEPSGWFDYDETEYTPEREVWDSDIYGRDWEYYGLPDDYGQGHDEARDENRGYGYNSGQYRYGYGAGPYDAWGTGYGRRRQPQEEEVRGIIEELEPVRTGRFGRSEMIALVRTYHGLRRRVALGPRSQLAGLDLMVGKAVSAVGRVEIVRGLPALVAGRVKTSEHQWVDVSRPKLARRFSYKPYEEYGHEYPYGYRPNYKPYYGYEEGDRGWDQHSDPPARGDRRNAVDWHERLGRNVDVYGEIHDLQVIRSARFEDPQLEGMIETNDGHWRRLILGPMDRLRRLNIKDGDLVDATGKIQDVGGTPTLVASQFTTDEIARWVPVHRAGAAEWYQGRILNLRSAKFRGIEPRQEVAEVRLNNGKVVPVNLGPVYDLPSGIREGESLEIWARGGKINGKKALVAERLNVQGRMVRIDRSAERLKFQSQRRQPWQQEGQASARRQQQP